ncbi:MAG: acetate kinase [Clostridiales bacterium]|jgi:acetate kinase|nr:acetate kinase [Clostridiales bacterium]
MKILVLNCGSSSLKYQLFDMENESVLAKGICEKIGMEGSFNKHEAAGEEVKTVVDLENHSVAVKFVLDALMNEKTGVIKNVSEISAVGHRVVHGGEDLYESVIIDEKVKKLIDQCSDLAPLHNPPNLIGINACEAIMPNTPQVAVFDTAFHHTMPKMAYLYALPYKYYQDYKVRKYGFHGTSHRYVAGRAAEILGKKPEDLKIITCHLGNGASICAVKGGKSVDTSMGFTPLEGLMMGTRSGDLDPAAVLYIMEKENLSPKETGNILNKQSGVLGVAGIGKSDFRDIENAVAEGVVNAGLSLEMFDYRVAKYVGEYAAAMNGVDAIVFTAGIGENSAARRTAICSYLEYLGLKVDGNKNNTRGKEIIFSTDDSAVKAIIIPTNEELVIARDTLELVKK